MSEVRHTVVLADDHPTVRSGIRADLGPPFEVVGEAGDAGEALRLIETLLPDLVVCDLNMPGGGGLQVVRQTVARFGDRVRVVMFTVSEHERDLLDAVACGAFGYLIKSTPGPELHRQLLRAANGDPPFAPELALHARVKQAALQAGHSGGRSSSRAGVKSSGHRQSPGYFKL